MLHKIMKEVTPLKIAAIAGSNANHSYNRMLLEFIAKQYKDTDEVDDRVVHNIPRSYLVEGGDVAESDKVCPDDSDDESDDGHGNTAGPALSGAESCCERTRYKHDECECEDHQGQKGHRNDFHFLPPFFPAEAGR